jgi:hypothetical protein
MKRGLTLATVWVAILGAAWAENVTFPLSSLPNTTAEHASQPAQLTPTSPQLERRDQAVTDDDLRILLRATELLQDESMWNRKDDRICDDDEAMGRRSLFCALQKACIDVLGKYDHRKVALQEVRFAVEEATAGRKFEHRLMEFNNLAETRLVDVKRVLQVAIDRVKSRLKDSGR